MSSNESSSSDESFMRPTSARDSRLDSFLRQAASILAAERGLNETSRLKLQSLADELRLPQALYDRAISEINRSGQLSQLTRTEQHFAQFLTDEMGKLSAGILSAQTEAKAIHIAEGKYQIAPERAREIIRQQATHLGIKRVSQSEAEQYIEDLCRQLLSGAAIPTDDQKSRIDDFGNLWGLNANQCEAILQGVAKANASVSGDHGSRATWFWAVTTLVLVAAFASFAIYLFRDRRQPKPLAATDPRASNAAKNSRIEPPRWWPDELYQEVANIFESTPEYRELLLATTSEKPQARQGAILQLTKLMEHRPQAPTAFTPRLVAALVTAEPDLSVVDSIVDEWSRHLAPEDSLELARPANVESAAYAAALLFELWKANASTVLSDNAARILSDAYGVYLRADVEPGQLEMELVAARLSLFWNHLVEKAWSNPNDAVSLFVHLRQTDPKNREHAREALFAILDASASQWSVLQGEIKQFIETDKYDDLLAWIEWSVPEKEPAFIQWVIDAIADRLQLKLPDRDLARGIRLLRASLAPQPVTNKELKKRWVLLREKKALLIDNPANESFTDAQRLANATYIATLAIVLHGAQRSPFVQIATFDDLFEVDARKLSTVGGPVAHENVIAYRQVSKPATAIERQQLEKAIERLADAKASNFSRLQSLASLADVGDRFGDVAYSDATIIAQSLAAVDDPADLSEVEQSLRQIRHWPSVSLAWLDSMESSRVSVDHAFQIFASLFGEPAELENRTSWRVEMRALALRRMSDAIDATLIEPSDIPSQQWRELEQYVRELLVIRASAADTHLPSVAASDPVPRGEILIANRFDSEFIRIVFLEEIRAESLAANLSASAKTDGQTDSSTHGTLAKRLLDAEIRIANRLVSLHAEELP